MRSFLTTLFFIASFPPSLYEGKPPLLIYRFHYTPPLLLLSMVLIQLLFALSSINFVHIVFVFHNCYPQVFLIFYYFLYSFHKKLLLRKILFLRRSFFNTYSHIFQHSSKYLRASFSVSPNFPINCFRISSSGTPPSRDISMSILLRPSSIPSLRPFSIPSFRPSSIPSFRPSSIPSS